MREKIKILYELFYRKVNNQPNYIYCPSERAENQIDKFLGILDKNYKLESIGDQFLVTYFIFQFAYWSELNIESYEKKIMLTYIIGPKAFNRWKTRDTEYDYTINLFQVKKARITRAEALKSIESRNKKREDKLAYEDIERGRFKNTDRQFLHCIENTTLIHPRSIHCIVCKDKVDCKKLLEDRFPQIYHHRFKNKN